MDDLAQRLAEIGAASAEQEKTLRRLRAKVRTLRRVPGTEELAAAREAEIGAFLLRRLASTR